MNAIVRQPEEKNPGRIGSLSRLPVFLALEGKRVVVAGGNAAAAWKVELLLATGASVDIYAAELSEDMQAVVVSPPRGTATLYPRAWNTVDLKGAAVAVGAFEDDTEAAQFVASAHSAGVPVNVIDRPAHCDFAFGAIVNRSPLVIGISTGGAAPVFAQAIRARLEPMLPQGFALWAAAAGKWRSAIKASGLSFAGRRKVWQLFTALALKNPDRKPQDVDLSALIDEVKGIGKAAEAGSVTLVGAGPGDAELLTLRAVRALQSADVILFDDLVSGAVLDFARREARKILVGKTGHRPSCKQSEINAMMVSLATQGRRVVRLKGGDPLIFARASEEIDACREAGIPVEVVPGITAAQGAASRLGIPLTGRGSVRRVQFVTVHARDGQMPDFDWRSIADSSATTALYMPRRNLAQFVASAIDAGLPGETPSVAIASATRPDQHHIGAPLRELPAAVEASAPLTGPLLVLFGAALQRVAQSFPALANTRRIGA
jgi:uroporphyrin-III C-methyltransferase/precorrin-2 dehydrogenase/sirohydrochlorin ferrochelatase